MTKTDKSLNKMAMEAVGGAASVGLLLYSMDVDMPILVILTIIMFWVALVTSYIVTLSSSVVDLSRELLKTRMAMAKALGNTERTLIQHLIDHRTNPIQPTTTETQDG